MSTGTGTGAGTATGRPTRFRAATLYLIGVALVAVAIGLLVWFLALTANRGHLEDLVDGEDWGSNLVAAPFLVLMVAAAPLFLAEYTRRGEWRSRDRKFLQGGSNVVVLRPLSLWARLLWLVVAAACGRCSSPSRSRSSRSEATSSGCC